MLKNFAINPKLHLNIFVIGLNNHMKCCYHHTVQESVLLIVFNLDVLLCFF